MTAYYKWKMADDTEFKAKSFTQRLAWCFRYAWPMVKIPKWTQNMHGVLQ